MTERELFHLFLKITNTCIYTLAHVWEVEIVDIGCLIQCMYFIVLGGESVSPNKIGHSDSVALRPTLVGLVVGD